MMVQGTLSILTPLWQPSAAADDFDYDAAVNEFTYEGAPLPVSFDAGSENSTNAPGHGDQSTSPGS